MRPTDLLLDDYRNIPDADLVRQRGTFVAEGRLVVRRLLTDSALRVRSVLLTDTAREAMADVLATRPDVPVYVVPQTTMNEVAGFEIHRGCLAVGERPTPRPWRDITTSARTVVVLERVSNADNVGSIIRSAAAFGTDAVLLDPTSTDPLYRKAIRTSMGAALVMPFARMDPWPGALHDLRTLGFATVGMTPSSSAPRLAETMEALAGGRVALLLGHEGDGLSACALEACAFTARIPVTSRVDSLNVATATAIALYERGRTATAADDPSRPGWTEPSRGA